MSSSVKPELARKGIPMALSVALFILFNDKMLCTPSIDGDISTSLAKSHQLHRNDHCPLDPITTAFISTNSSQYTWMGNHFTPPPNIPIFPPEEYVSQFGKRNTLFIGDSTMRRAYGTLHAIMTGKDPADLTVYELSAPQVIDFGKAGRLHRQPCRVLMGHGVDLPKDNSGFDCRHVIANRDNYEEDLINATTSSREISATLLKEKELYYDGSTEGKSDYLGMPCISHILNEFFPERLPADVHATAKNGAEKRQLFRHYDTIVVGIGLWEGLRPHDCNIPSIPDKFQRIQLFLESMEQISSTDQQVVLRTPGFHQNHGGNEIVWNVVRRMKDYGYRERNRGTGQDNGVNGNIIESRRNNNEVDSRIQLSSRFSATHTNKTTMTTIPDTNHNTKNQSNITIVDFGTVISKRSFGNDRILGDMPVHYGVEARLLFGQQLLHELRAGELRKEIV